MIPYMAGRGRAWKHAGTVAAPAEAHSKQEPNIVKESIICDTPFFRNPTFQIRVFRAWQAAAAPGNMLVWLQLRLNRIRHDGA